MKPRSERRQFGRRQTGINAWVLVRGRPRLPARLINISSSGALIEMEAPLWLPFRFALMIEGHAATIDCELRQSSAHRIGVAFVCHIDASSQFQSPTSLLPSDFWMGPPARAIRQIA